MVILAHFSDWKWNFFTYFCRRVFAILLEISDFQLLYFDHCKVFQNIHTSLQRFKYLTFGKGYFKLLKMSEKKSIKNWWVMKCSCVQVFKIICKIVNHLRMMSQSYSILQFREFLSFWEFFSNCTITQHLRIFCFQLCRFHIHHGSQMHSTMPF